MTQNRTIDLGNVRRSRKRLSLFRRVQRLSIGLLLVLVGTAVFLAIDRNGLPLELGSIPVSSARTISAHPNLSRVIDADTIVVGDVRVRLDGISAPERGHEAYTKGKWFVADLMREATVVECELNGRKSYERFIGSCFFVLEDGARIDPQIEAVKAGFARDCPRYSAGRYREFETDASRALPLPGYC